MEYIRGVTGPGVGIPGEKPIRQEIRRQRDGHD